ncbi:DUF5462 family protein [Vibrio harveyi]|uniref:DUF5462 family protein n=1 Tax=Vibrio harveyi TaxID=669 RepID=UPI002380BBFA|nr:DUF5462 family protein [Vibrio harveyi]
MNRYLIVMLIFIPFFSFSESIISTSSYRNIGIVNGSVAKGKVLIEKNIENTKLFSLKYDDAVSMIVIRDIESFIENKNVLNFVSDKYKDIEISLRMIFLVDGVRSKVEAKISGGDLYIFVPDYLREFSINMENPLKINVPISYKGEFNFALNIEGRP